MYCKVTDELLSPSAITIPLARIFNFNVFPGESIEAVNVIRSPAVIDIFIISDQVFES